VLTGLQVRPCIEFSVYEDASLVFHDDTFGVKPPVKSSGRACERIHARDHSSLHGPNFIARETIKVDTFVNMVAPDESKRPRMVGSARDFSAHMEVNLAK
jgi:hypothetical protein